MKSEVKIQSGNLKAQFVIGFFLTVLTIFLAVWFTATFQVILLGVGGVATLGGMVFVCYLGSRARLTHHQKRLDIKIQTELARQEKYRSDKLEMERYIFAFDHKQRVIMPGWYRNVRTLDPVLSPRQMVIEAEANTPLLAASKPAMSDLLKDSDSVTFLGAKRSGKTNAAMFWLSRRPGRTIVLDVKAHNVWPENCRVVNEMGQFDRAIKMIIDEGQRRRKGAILDAPTVTLLADEIHYLRSKDIDIIGKIIDIATLYAEYRIFASFTSHGNTGKYLGIDAISLLDNFDAVHTQKINEEYFATVDLGNGPVEVLPPGRYTPANKGNRLLFVSADERIKRLVLTGASNYKICRKIWGSPNGARYKRIDAIRAFLGVDGGIDGGVDIALQTQP